MNRGRYVALAVFLIVGLARMWVDWSPPSQELWTFPAPVDWSSSVIVWWRHRDPSEIMCRFDGANRPCCAAGTSAAPDPLTAEARVTDCTDIWW